jgi:signal transduction histidine kinase
VESVDTGGDRLPIGRRYRVGDWRDTSPERRPLVRLALATGEIWHGPGHAIDGLPEILARSVESIRHTLVLPLRTASPPIVLIFGRRRDVDFGVGDVATLRTLGNMAALALRNAWLYGQVEETARVKTDFLNMAAHELRTPLTVVRGYLSMLREGSFGGMPDGWQQPLRILSAKSEELGHLVDDLLLLARLDQGRPLEQVPVELRRIAHDACADARAVAPQRTITLTAPQAVMVRGDELQLRQVVANLVNNAIDAVRINGHVELKAGRRGNGWPYFSVSDDGPGVSDDHRHHLFEPHFTTKEGGTGLGLFMSYGIVREHQGQLLYEGNRRGAIFTVTVPPFGN